MLLFNYSAIDIGFERVEYTASEPVNTLTINQEVCMVVTRGAVGRQLSVLVDWAPGTAQRTFNVSLA